MLNKHDSQLQSSSVSEPQVNQAPKANKTKKVSFLRLLSDLGSYFFNRHSDASSLNADISALEAERQAAKANSQSNRQTKIPSLADHAARIKHLNSTDPKLELPERLQIITPPPALAQAQASEGRHSSSKSAAVSANQAASVNQPTIAPAKPSITASQPASSGVVPARPASVAPAIPVTALSQSVSLPVASSMPKQSQAIDSQAPKPLSQTEREQLKDKKTKAARNLSAERVEHTKQILKSKIENRAWNSYGSAQVNLIKEHRSMFFNWQSKMLSMIFFVLLTCLICVLAYGYLLILEKEKQNSNLYIFTNLDNINRQIATVQQELNSQIVPFNDKLMYTGYMLDNHLYWTNFFKFLERETLSDVYYANGLDVSINGNVKGSNGVFEIWSIAKNYNSISNQTKVFSKSNSGYVLSVDATDTDALAKASSTTPQVGLLPVDASQAVRFKLKLTLDPRLFLRFE